MSTVKCIAHHRLPGRAARRVCMAHLKLSGPDLGHQSVQECRVLRCRFLISKTHSAHTISAGPAHKTPGAAAAEAGKGLTSNLRARAGRSTCAGTEASLPDMRNTVGTAASGPRVSCARAHTPRQVLRSRACVCCKSTPALALPTTHSACSHTSSAQTHPYVQALVVCEFRKKKKKKQAPPSSPQA